MSERDEIRLAAVTDIERVVNADGSADEVFEIRSNCDCARDELVEVLDETFGPGYLTDKKPPHKSSSQFGFSGKRWKSPWNPEGPKPNWQVGPPADPSLN